MSDFYRQPRPHRRRRQQALDCLGDRAGGCARGARLALTYQGERLEENVRELAADARSTR